MYPRRAMLRSLFAVTAAMTALAVGAPRLLRAQPAAGSDRVAVDVELEACGKALRRVARLFSAGFTRADADRLERDIDALPTDKAAQWTYQVTHDGQTATLTVHAVVDELSMVDLDFVTTPAIAARIRKALGDLER